ncbi:redox-sensitive transcriptional activator SoxR [Thalassotalea mangrovi]|uniref:Redox-sensitive transcriptional activator SoxR n=1 Tax=Thalassotalea mangrovi TaxID=2572245 RepID=A0A4U1B5I5_9GAMM|nr:redox-sensitive transcriptional activator SoxR [Thalassotalea mangrovi]TKB44889.1 redox-sensitive transcriptional activator SoxR [Thalassotalea mangrovi]
MSNEATLSVGRVAQRCGIKVSTLHFYEQKGLIKSWRNQGNQRRYRPDVLRRISVIKAAQKLGITLEEIKTTLATLPDNRTPTIQDWQQISQSWHQMLNQRIRQLENLRDSLGSCIGCGCLSLTKCPLYNPDDKLAQEGPGPVILNEKSRGQGC